MISVRTADQLRAGTTFVEPEENCYGRDPRVITLGRTQNNPDAARPVQRLRIPFQGTAADVIALDGQDSMGRRTVVAYVPSQRVMVVY